MSFDLHWLMDCLEGRHQGKGFFEIFLLCFFLPADVFGTKIVAHSIFIFIVGYSHQERYYSYQDKQRFLMWKNQCGSLSIHGLSWAIFYKKVITWTIKNEDSGQSNSNLPLSTKISLVPSTSLAFRQPILRNSTM